MGKSHFSILVSLAVERFTLALRKSNSTFHECQTMSILSSITNAIFRKERSYKNNVDSIETLETANHLRDKVLRDFLDPEMLERCYCATDPYKCRRFSWQRIRNTG